MTIERAPAADASLGGYCWQYGKDQAAIDARLGGPPGPAIAFLDAALRGRITDDTLRDWWRGRPKGSDK